jgi:hypothetical protein
MYSYDLIKAAAEAERLQPQYQKEKAVQKLTHPPSQGWVRGLLDRYKFNMRRITTVDKSTRPEPSAVRAIMEDIQKLILEHKIPLSGVFNGDEYVFVCTRRTRACVRFFTFSHMPSLLTPYPSHSRTSSCWGANPLFQYAPVDAGSVGKPDNNDRGRFTSMLACSASGTLVPPSFIVKCDTPALNQQGQLKVLDSLHKMPSFTAADGWTSSWWEGDVTTKKNTVHCKRQYLQHSDGRIIWAQPNAYMDSCGMMMWVDLVLGPLKVKSGDARWVMVWDSCSSHLTESVLAKFEAFGIFVRQLPVNMTDLLQVLDIVVNGPLKRATRRERARGLYDYFQEWRAHANDRVLQAYAKDKRARDEALRLQKPAPPPSVPVFPPFNPPRPTILDGLKCVASAYQGMNTSSFREGIQRTFVKVGLAPHSGSSYRAYPHSHQQFKAPCFLADKPSTTDFSAGDCIDPFSFQRKEERAPPGEKEEGEEGEGEPEGRI